MADYYWFDPVTELQSLVDVNDPNYWYYESWLFPTVPLQLLDLDVFCSQEQPTLPPLAVNNFMDGSYVQILVNYALAVVFNNKCGG